jgi:hypothetical protein
MTREHIIHLFSIFIPINFVAEGLAQIIRQSCYIIISIMKVIIITIPCPILQCSWTAEKGEEKKGEGKKEINGVGKVKYVADKLSRDPVEKEK